jgi:hydroxyethylthiazole kinase-like uncharacterized protein yjeF
VSFNPQLNTLFDRVETSHKGQVGRIGVVAGSASMLGAAILVCNAALRAGAGLVYLMTIESNGNLINISHPEIIVLPLPSRAGVLTYHGEEKISEYVQRYKIDCIAIGPGLNSQFTTRKLVTQVLKNVCSYLSIPTVVDADALNASSYAEFADLKKGLFVLTPHVGEFERLFKEVCPEWDPTSESSRKETTEKAAQKSGQLVVLKGHHSVVSDGTTTFVNQSGNPGMATAGAGDVLTGVIASIIGQGVSLLDGASGGVYLHGLAGDLAFEKMGNSLIASDIIGAIPEALSKIKNEY